MAKAYMPTYGVAYPIESINRKLALRRETAGVKDSAYSAVGERHLVIPGAKYMGGMTKTAVVVSGNGKKETINTNYLFVRKFGRTSSPSTLEINLHNVFSEASRGKNHIVKDLMQITRVQQMWLQACADTTKLINEISAKGRTFNGWVFAVQYSGLYKKIVEEDQAYATYDKNTFPQNFDA